jgi:phosphohistidine phosphatase
MKKLIFVRHGRAEEPTSTLPDFERSLTPKGKNISLQMAVSLKEREKNPGVYISSPAFRALETALIFAREFELDPEKIIIKSNLYFKINLNSFAKILEEIGDEVDTIIMFGHNPSFTVIPDRLSRDGCDFMPKSGVVCLSFKTNSWTGIIHEKGKMEYSLKPDKTL